MTSTTITKRGYDQSALSACPAPGAAAWAHIAFLAAARLRRSGVEVRPQGSGMPNGRLVADLPTVQLVQFVQHDPGDTARRPPA